MDWGGCYLLEFAIYIYAYTQITHICIYKQNYAGVFEMKGHWEACGMEMPAGDLVGIVLELCAWEIIINSIANHRA